ncbi:GNAT family N-acetyltransferase [Flavobacterium sp. PL002]|uniref:GNAT family N-acetyltransferase n=1 Tax=Flavobacterium sp. PL002 TaxID=1897058 RepID=UPI001787F32A|nr:GNAT family N-acetyltransferase [Flavobacterium sp. PL002]MBE0390793.1 Amino-acid acetyltransferase [Flavobacterium sp. PL002]
MIRKYSQKDKLEVIKLLQQNTLDYFDPAEESDLENYLEKEVEDYFVYEENEKIIGAGGINYFAQDRIARISWDLIAPEAQGMGIGKKLTHFRFSHLNNNPNVELIVVRTTQLVYGFYEKMGFNLIKVEKDFWAKGFDLYLMQMKNRIDAK